MIRRHKRRRAAAFVFALGVTSLRTNSGRPNEALNAIDAALLTELTQVVADFTVAVHAAAFQP